MIEEFDTYTSHNLTYEELKQFWSNDQKPRKLGHNLTYEELKLSHSRESGSMTPPS